MVIAHAHQAEIAALRARDRALRRLQLVQHERNPRRWTRATVAAMEATAVVFATQRRHSHWYRAYLRARRQTP